jgi:hypothetical protein
MTDQTTTSFVPGDSERLTAKLRAAHNAPLLSPDRIGLRDPRTHRLFTDLYHEALEQGLCFDRDQFLLLIGKTLANCMLEKIASEPVLTFSNLTLVERALFPKGLLHAPGKTRDRMLSAKVAVYNQALDFIFTDGVCEEVKQFARDVTDALTQDLSGRNGVCGCDHPLHLRLDCPLHGGHS